MQNHATEILRILISYVLKNFCERSLSYQTAPIILEKDIQSCQVAKTSEIKNIEKTRARRGIAQPNLLCIIICHGRSDFVLEDS